MTKQFQFIFFRGIEVRIQVRIVQKLQLIKSVKFTLNDIYFHIQNNEQLTQIRFKQLSVFIKISIFYTPWIFIIPLNDWYISVSHDKISYWTS